MKPLLDEHHHTIEVFWSRPRPYDSVVANGSEHDDKAKLYTISRRFGKAAPKVIYIGKTWSQNVSQRLRQPDHKERYARWSLEYPHQSFWVSFGIVSVKGGRFTRRRLDETERLLTYVCDSAQTENRTNIWTHNLTDAFSITNAGSRGTIPRKVILGVMTS